MDTHMGTHALQLQKARTLRVICFVLTHRHAPRTRSADGGGQTPAGWPGPGRGGSDNDPRHPVTPSPVSPPTCTPRPPPPTLPHLPYPACTRCLPTPLVLLVRLLTLYSPPRPFASSYLRPLSPIAPATPFPRHPLCPRIPHPQTPARPPSRGTPS